MTSSARSEPGRYRYRYRLRFLSLMGPGLLVMLADTDAGSLIISAQSGMAWGYRLLLQQFLLIPVLFIAQELAVRLGLVTGMGYGELIKARFGPYWAGLFMISLLACCIGALLTEFTGLAAVSELFNIPSWQTLTVVITFLIFIACTGSYHSVERIAICFGVFELIFLWAAWQAKPQLHHVSQQLFDLPLQEKEYLILIAGNIGAVIMPWMIFFHQSAVLDSPA